MWLLLDLFFGVPNISGWFSNFAMQDSASNPLSDGCFTNLSPKGYGGYGTLDQTPAFDGYSLNASLSSSIYKEGATIRPNSFSVLVLLRL
ncbi:hypothetical protein [Succinatimonas hippei]|uniref:hypothetical protein n=1 Tax=Succinatimonas hippei TaxID=626938 RepID=UPI002490D21B|nr:hypothetical protein [Succinatimonas hippei]